MANLPSRRNFCKLCLGLVPIFAGITMIAGSCGANNTDKKPNASSDPCADFSGLSKGNLEARKKLNYVDESSDKNKVCEHCNLFIPAKATSSCGGCMLFKDPVKPEGTCIYWTPKTEKSV